MKVIALVLAGAAFAAPPLLAQAAQDGSAPQPAAGAAAPAAAAPNVAVGAQVSDAQGGAVGTIESVSGTGAVLSTGSAKATLPLTAFAQGPNGLVIGMTKTDLEAAIAKASGGPQAAGEQTASSASAAATPASITVGASVSDPKGGKVGTVEAVSGNLVTVATPNAKAQLPKSAFAQGENGLVIAMTAAELEAAAKAAGTPRKSGS